MHAKPALLALAAAATAPLAANEVTVYRDRGFSGPAVAVSEANPDLRLVWPVNSIRVAAGTWELCPERNFRGRCITLSSSSPNLAMTHGWRGRLQSIRPVGDSGWGGGWSGWGQVPSDNRSMRGMASEYFPQPASRGYRVEACPGGLASAACVQRSADSFCRSGGWNRSAFQRTETVRGRNYLADVLCTRS